mmetsp:Transcript_173340/g.556015  ORF Transcript_173340/g.556015 Transcript_173340/m.556015 type:complete len:519 (-) Transcript_173340:281-1837(-)
MANPGAGHALQDALLDELVGRLVLDAGQQPRTHPRRGALLLALRVAEQGTAQLHGEVLHHLEVGARPVLRGARREGGHEGRGHHGRGEVRELYLASPEGCQRRGRHPALRDALLHRPRVVELSEHIPRLLFVTRRHDATHPGHFGMQLDLDLVRTDLVRLRGDGLLQGGLPNLEFRLVIGSGGVGQGFEVHIIDCEVEFDGSGADFQVIERYRCLQLWIPCGWQWLQWLDLVIAHLARCRAVLSDVRAKHHVEAIARGRELQRVHDDRRRQRRALAGGHRQDVEAAPEVQVRQRRPLRQGLVVIRAVPVPRLFVIDGVGGLERGASDGEHPQIGDPDGPPALRDHLADVDDRANTFGEADAQRGQVPGECNLNLPGGAVPRDADLGLHRGAVAELVARRQTQAHVLRRDAARQPAEEPRVRGRDEAVEDRRRARQPVVADVHHRPVQPSGAADAAAHRAVLAHEVAEGGVVAMRKGRRTVAIRLPQARITICALEGPAGVRRRRLLAGHAGDRAIDPH